MGGSAPPKDYSMDAFTAAMNAASSGQDWNTISNNFSSSGNDQYMQVARMGFDMGAPAQQAETGYHEPSSYGASSESTYDPVAAAAEAEAARVRAAGIADRDSGYGAYLDAGEKATNFVDSEIANERANAALLGIDYAMEDDVRSSRISDYFGTLWSGENDTSLRGLISEYGDPTGFQGYTFERGTGGYYDTQEGSETLVSATGTRPGLVTEDDEETLGAVSVLGV